MPTLLLVPDAPTPQPDPAAAPVGPSFAAMDAAAGFEAALDYLRDMDEIEGVRAMKARTYELVGARPGARILDVGCGDGADVDRIAGIVGPSGEAVGLDPSRRLLEQARSRHRGRFVHGSADAPPFAAHAFDGARLDRVLVHLPSPRSALAAVARVVRPDGCVLVCETHFSVEGDDPRPDPEAVDLLMRRIAGDERDSSWIGHFVPLLMRQAGLERQHAEQLEETTADPDDLLRCLGLWRQRPELPAHAEAWLDAALEGMREGRRLLHLRTSVVTGRAQ